MDHVDIEHFLKLNIDGSCIGLEPREGENTYFCTPEGAEVIGWAGTDGIHYCFVDGFGEMVFTVSPMNTPGNYVHPVARDFTDFLRLLLACGDAAALEQVYCWDQAQFDGFMRDNPLTAEQQAVLDTIREKLMLAPMEQPFAYIKKLQAEFDYSSIEYPKDYYDQFPGEAPIPEWKVYFDGGFWGHDGCDECGMEFSLNKQFTWGDALWYVPAIYSCDKGLVVDFCMQVPAECIRSFMDKWQLPAENHGIDLTDEQQMQIDADNPVAIHMKPRVVLNGTEIILTHGCGVSWNPFLPEGHNPWARSAIQHYGLDPAYGWAIWRAAFLWTPLRKPQIKTLSVTLMKGPLAISGPHFHVSASGARFEFTHPTTGARHTLTVQEYEQKEMPNNRFKGDYECPEHYILMCYTLSPDLPDGAFIVTDCKRSDKPRQKYTNPSGSSASGVCVSVGIIGGADGPTVLFVGGSEQGKSRAACSSLHFEPVDKVEWRMVFYEKKHEDITVELI